MKESIDPSAIIIDPSTLLNTEIDNIKLEFKRLIEKLIDKTKEVPITDPKALNGRTGPHVWALTRLSMMLVLVLISRWFGSTSFEGVYIRMT